MYPIEYIMSFLTHTMQSKCIWLTSSISTAHAWIKVTAGWKLQPRGRDELQCVCYCVCVRAERAGTRLPAPVNSSDQSLHLIPVYFQESRGHFSFTLSPLCAAKALPPAAAAAAARPTLSRNLERAWVPALLTYFTVPKLYGQIPSDLPLVKLAARGRAGTPASHTHWFMSTQSACFKWLQTHTAEWNYVSSSAIWPAAGRVGRGGGYCGNVSLLLGRIMLKWEFSLW